ncbi:DUF4372 domain-containing protein [Spirochaeta cellobiosiphila]|uniref:DUF4372 domain-containing protein n=1 Tax=Spirochaeta cellobiosiphila TaxID=504483 RepID=UPI003CCB93D0
MLPAFLKNYKVISRSQNQKRINEYQEDKKVRTFRTYDLFQSLLFGQVTPAYSLREIVDVLKVYKKKLYHIGMKDIDTTIIELYINRFDWALFRSSKVAIKLHVAFNPTSMLPEKVISTIEV